MERKIRVPLLALALAAVWGPPKVASASDIRSILTRKPEEAPPVAKAGSGRDEFGDPEPGTRVSNIEDAIRELVEDVDETNKCSQALEASAGDGREAVDPGAPPALPDGLLYRRDTLLKQKDKACTTANLQDLLIEQRRALRFLKKSAGRCGKEPGCGTREQTRKLRDDIDVMQSNLNTVLEREGLREPFVAELITGLAFGTPAEGNSDEDTAELPSAFVRWRSNPFGFGYDAERDLDFTFGGRFGYMPALALVAPEPEAPATTPPTTTPPAPTPPATTPTTPTPAPAAASDTLDYQEAFGWDLRFNARRHFGDRVQLVASAGGGQMILNTKSTMGKLDGKDTLFTVVPNGIGRAAFFYDAHVAFRYFKSNRDVRADQQSINPGFELSFGVRHDTRFKKDDKTSLVSYDSPERRYLFRMLLSDLRVLDRRKPADSKEAPTFVVTFGIEHEFGGRNGLPSVTRVLLVGDLAILKALNGSRK